jgi:hypothetical protein
MQNTSDEKTNNTCITVSFNNMRLKCVYVLMCIKYMKAYDSIIYSKICNK